MTSSTCTSPSRRGRATCAPCSPTRRRRTPAARGDARRPFDRRGRADGSTRRLETPPVRARERGRDGPHPRLLCGEVGVRTAPLPDPLEPPGRRQRVVLAGLLPARPRRLPRDDDPEAAPRSQEEPEAAAASRALSGDPDQALL